MPSLPIETDLLHSALPLILSAAFAIDSASAAFAQDQQSVWSGQAQCQLTIQSPTYSYQETQTWTITGAPNANGIYLATWSVLGQGQRQDTPGAQTTAAQWNTSVPPMSAPLAIFVNSAHQLIIKSYHAQLRVDGVVTGLRQAIISGVTQKPSAVSFAEFEWQFPRIEVEGTKNDVKGTSSDPIRSSIGPMQPAGLPGTAKCEWQFSKSGIALPGPVVIPATQAAAHAEASQRVTAVNTTAAVTSPGLAISSGSAKPAGQRGSAQPGYLPGAAEVKTSTTKPQGATTSSQCQAVERPQDPMVMGTFRAGKSVSHSGTLASATDSQFFQLKLPSGVDAEISLTGVQGSDFDLYVYHSDFSPISCSQIRGVTSKNIKTQLGNSQSNNIVIVEVRTHIWSATSPAYTLTFKGIAGGAASP